MREAKPKDFGGLPPGGSGAPRWWDGGVERSPGSHLEALVVLASRPRGSGSNRRFMNPKNHERNLLVDLMVSHVLRLQEPGVTDGTVHQGRETMR